MSLFAQNQREKTREKPWGLFWGGGSFALGCWRGASSFGVKNPAANLICPLHRTAHNLFTIPKYKILGGKKAADFSLIHAHAG